MKAKIYFLEWLSLRASRLFDFINQIMNWYVYSDSLLNRIKRSLTIRK